MTNGKNMKNTDWLVVALMAQYFVIAGFYAWQKDWARVMYWVAAIFINGSTLLMR